MTKETLDLANDLNRRIKILEQAKNCFSWETDNGIEFPTHPKLIIEFDGNDGREQLAIPSELNDVIITDLLKWFSDNLARARTEFEML